MYENYIGEVFDNRYKIERIIGIGGMAVVFEAYDAVMKRMVALKMLKEEISHDTQSVKRFINESKAVAMLSHPNIVKIYDVSVRENRKYIVMERVEGITLKNYLNKKGTLGMREMLQYTEQILLALEHAHSKGIVHRDIKPQNIMLLKNGVIKVTDFGIAKLPNAETVTMTNKAIGTVYYISPEQASGKKVDRRSDIYSLGVMMYEMCTGKLPFVADSPVSVALMHVKDQPKRPTEIVSSIPSGLEQIIMGAMEKQPDKRIQSASQMLRLIERIKKNPEHVFKTKKKQGEITKLDMSLKKSHTAAQQRVQRSMFPIILGVMCAFILVVGITTVTIFVRMMNDDSNQPYSITVETLVGEKYSDELKTGLESKNYRITVEYVNSDDEENTIVGQSPEGGVKKKVIDGKQFCELTLKVSMGVEKIVLENYANRDKAEVITAIRSLGLFVDANAVTTKYDDNIPSGRVISTDPPAGTTVKKGDKISLTVSIGAEKKMVTVPDYTKWSLAEAVADIKKSGLIATKETEEYSDDIEIGKIITQSVPANTEVQEGTEITLTVSLGKKPDKTQDDKNPDKTSDDKQ